MSFKPLFSKYCAIPGKGSFGFYFSAISYKRYFEFVYFKSFIIYYNTFPTVRAGDQCCKL